MQRIGQHPASAILRGINALIRIGPVDRQIPIVVVEDIRSTEWASITFTGLRHEFDLRLEGEPDSVAGAIVRLVDDLADSELPMAGHFVAEIAVATVAAGEAIAGGEPGQWRQRLRIEALTVRD